LRLERRPDGVTLPNKHGTSVDEVPLKDFENGGTAKVVRDGDGDAGRRASAARAFRLAARARSASAVT
jgi:hypothetical protein